MTETIKNPSAEPSEQVTQKQPKGRDTRGKIQQILRDNPSIEVKRRASVAKANKTAIRNLTNGKKSQRMRNKARDIFFRDFNRLVPKKQVEDSPLLMSFWNSVALSYSILQSGILGQESDRQLSIYNRRYIDSLSKFYNAMHKTGKLTSAQMLAFKTSGESFEPDKKEAGDILNDYFKKEGDDKIVKNPIDRQSINA